MRGVYICTCLVHIALAAQVALDHHRSTRAPVCCLSRHLRLKCMACVHSRSPGDGRFECIAQDVRSVRHDPHGRGAPEPVVDEDLLETELTADPVCAIIARLRSFFLVVALIVCSLQGRLRAQDEGRRKPLLQAELPQVYAG